MTLRPSDEDTELYVEGYFTDAIPRNNNELRPAYLEEFYSPYLDPPATDTFDVPREPSWGPTERCAGDEDPNNFRLPNDRAHYVPRKRWRTRSALRSGDMVAKVKAIGTMRIYSLGHMIFVNWIVGLGRQDDRAPAIIELLYRLLQTFDWQGAIPMLLVEFQPQIVAPNTTSSWPTNTNFKCAAERWVGCYPPCLQLPLQPPDRTADMGPELVQSDNAPAVLREAVRDEMINQARTVFGNLRHLVYREYALNHIKAALASETFGWTQRPQRLSLDSRSELRRR